MRLNVAWSRRPYLNRGPADCGLRRADAAALDLDDVNATTREFAVRGKGVRELIVHATNGSLEALQAWAEVRDQKPGVFVPVNKG